MDFEIAPVGDAPVGGPDLSLLTGPFIPPADDPWAVVRSTVVTLTGAVIIFWPVASAAAANRVIQVVYKPYVASGPLKWLPVALAGDILTTPTWFLDAQDYVEIFTTNPKIVLDIIYYANKLGPADLYTGPWVPLAIDAHPGLTFPQPEAFLDP